MKQIPLPPLKPRSKTSQDPGKAAQPPERRSLVRRVVRGVGWLGSSPVHWMGVGSIRQGASFIGGMAEQARACPVRDPRFKTAEQGAFDLRATAFSMGIGVSELERRLALRRKQTALMAYLLGALGAMFLLAWLLRMLSTPTEGGRLLLAVDFLPFCVLFVLLAFYQALVNFQLRIGRTAGWREYLLTEDGFWPHP